MWRCTDTETCDYGLSSCGSYSRSVISSRFLPAGLQYEVSIFDQLWEDSEDSKILSWWWLREGGRCNRIITNAFESLFQEDQHGRRRWRGERASVLNALRLATIIFNTTHETFYSIVLLSTWSTISITIHSFTVCYVFTLPQLQWIQRIDTMCAAVELYVLPPPTTNLHHQASTTLIRYIMNNFE